MHSFWIFRYFIHSFHHINTVNSSVAIRWGSFSISSSLVSSVEKTSLGCRDENRSQACLKASRRATLLIELRRTLTDLRRTLGFSIGAVSSRVFPQPQESMFPGVHIWLPRQRFFAVPFRILWTHYLSSIFDSLYSNSDILWKLIGLNSAVPIQGHIAGILVSSERSCRSFVYGCKSTS